ncbi:MAG: hypothetical protein H7841_08375 [Magnetospirillum sp. WYHS-4]
MTQHDTDKSARARALVDGWLVANAHKANSPAYLAHLLWCKAKCDRAFKCALVRMACQHVAAAAFSNLNALSKEA